MHFQFFNNSLRIIWWNKCGLPNRAKENVAAYNLLFVFLYVKLWQPSIFPYGVYMTKMSSLSKIMEVITVPWRISQKCCFLRQNMWWELCSVSVVNPRSFLSRVSCCTTHVHGPFGCSPSRSWNMFITATVWWIVQSFINQKDRGYSISLTVVQYFGQYA